MREAIEDVIELKVIRTAYAKPREVFREILKINDFVTFMPNVKKSEIIERKGLTVKTRWSIEIDGIPISWIEEEVVDPLRLTIRFRALEGDLEKFDGEWVLKPDPKGTRIEIGLRAGLGIPLIERLVSKTLKEKIEKNFVMMIESLNNKIVSERYRNFRAGKYKGIGGFAIIGHPYNLNNLIRYLKYLKPDIRVPSREFLLKVYELVPSYVMYDIRDFKSSNGRKSHGLVIVSTFIPDMVKLNSQLVFNKVVEACRVAETHQIGIAALGGFTSIVGEEYSDQLQKRTHVSLTTGNTFTASLAIDGVFKACDLMGVNLHSATLAVIGGTGDIGGACAKVLKDDVKELIITGRDPEKVKATVQSLQVGGSRNIRGSTDNLEAVQKADVIIAAASVTSSIIDVNTFKPGAVICDLAYPKNISHVPTNRKDILIFSGGLAQIPQDIELGFEIGLPSVRTLYGCFAEAVLLDLEKRYESFSHGRGNITAEKIDEIRQIAKRHGFPVAPFYWCDRVVTNEDIQQIRRNAATHQPKQIFKVQK